MGVLRTLHAKFKLNLRHLFANLDFAGLVEDAPLLEAVGFLQTLSLHGKSPRQANPVQSPRSLLTAADNYLSSRGNAAEDMPGLPPFGAPAVP